MLTAWYIHDTVVLLLYVVMQVKCQILRIHYNYDNLLQLLIAHFKVSHAPAVTVATTMLPLNKTKRNSLIVINLLTQSRIQINSKYGDLDVCHLSGIITVCCSITCTDNNR